MNDISISVENPSIVERPSTNNRSNEDFEIIPYNRENNATTNRNSDTSDEIQYIFFALNFVVFDILSFIETIHHRQNMNLVNEYLHFFCLQ